MEDKEIAKLFADGKMKVKHTWLRAYDSESGKEGWISVESILSNIIKELDASSTKGVIGCGKKMDALGYIHCGEFDDLKHGYKQWLCDDCLKNTECVKDIHQEIKKEIDKDYAKTNLNENKT